MITIDDIKQELKRRMLEDGAYGTIPHLKVWSQRYQSDRALLTAIEGLENALAYDLSQKEWQDARTNFHVSSFQAFAETALQTIRDQWQ